MPEKKDGAAKAQRPGATGRGCRTALLAAYVVCAFLAFPQPLGDRVLDLGRVLGWVYPAFLMLGLRGLSPRRAAWAGFAAGLVANSAILHWIYVVTVVYGHAPWFAGVLAPVGLAVFAAVFAAAFGVGLSWLERRNLDTPLLLAALWTAMDHARGNALSGFPWATLGYTQHLNEALMGLAAYTGVYGLSFTAALGAAVLARSTIAWRKGRRPDVTGWSALAIVVFAHLFGFMTATRVDEGRLPTVRVAVLQGNIDQGVKWSPDWSERTLGIYSELTRQAARQGADLIVWPESAVPGGVEPHRAVGLRLSALASETGVRLVVGGIGFTYDAVGRIAEFFDSAFAIDEQGRHIDRYDKAHLVPFGEYVPLRSLLGSVLSAVASGIASGDVSAGPGPRPIVFPVADRTAGSEAMSVGVPICYELLFPDLVRHFVDDGAALLLGITNDAWYGRTGAPHQFLAITAMRSAETRVWTARAANTGVSAFIDARGRVRARTRIFERDLLVADVPLRSSPVGGSFYTRQGDWFAWACWASLGIAGVLSRPGASSNAESRRRAVP